MKTCKYYRLQFLFPRAPLLRVYLFLVDTITKVKREGEGPMGVMGEGEGERWEWKMGGGKRRQER